MECPSTTEGWLRESIAWYNRSLKDNASLYGEDRSMFFFRQYQFASGYAFRARELDEDEQKQEVVNAQVRHWFAALPDKYDQIANEPDFAFAFCYLFANHLLGFIEREAAWRVLAYLTRHWDEADELVELPEELERQMHAEWVRDQHALKPPSPSRTGPGKQPGCSR